MTTERRAAARIRGPFEASWSGTSTHRSVRITDVSDTGCFIEDLAAPAPGERVEVSITLPGCPVLTVAGTVVYLYPAQGFAVVFDDEAEPTRALRQALRDLRR